MRQIYVGLLAEGSTDIRFLLPIVKKTVDRFMLDECRGLIDIELTGIKLNETGLTFAQKVVAASKKGVEDFEMLILCVHADADSKTSDKAYQERIQPAQQELNRQNRDAYCHTLVAIVPIQETEAWMLADKDLFKKQIDTDISDIKLGIEAKPELLASPKEVIQNAIQIASAKFTKKRRKNLNIAELYESIGSKLELEKLEQLSSYQDFRKNIQTAFKTLNLLH